MPTLQFKGKNIIWNHHLSIPYHTLEEVSKLNFQENKGEGNLILKAIIFLRSKRCFLNMRERLSVSISTRLTIRGMRAGYITIG